MEMKNLIGLCILTVFLVGCSGFGSGGKTSYGPEFERVGREGVTMDFASGTPPETLLFVSQGDQMPFEVDVRVRNRGSSLVKGAIYISGYDPNLIEFDEVQHLSDFKDCDYAVENIGFGSFSGFLRCRSIDLGSFGSPALGIGIRDGGLILDLAGIDLGMFFGGWAGEFIDHYLGPANSNLRFEIGANGMRLDVNFETEEFDPEYGFRGPFFLSLWSPIDFSTNNGMPFLLPGDTPEFPGGGEEFITFHGRVNDLPNGVEKTKQQFLITSCYLYTTYVSPNVCIDISPGSQTDKVCNRASYFNSKGQGGPVGVTSITQYASPSTQDNGLGFEVFTLTIENLGGGTVYYPSRITACSPYYPLPASGLDVNAVIVGSIQIGEKMLECADPYPHTVILTNGKGTVTCWIPFSETGGATNTGFSTPLIVELWYGYSETIKAEMTIHKLRKTGTDRSTGPRTMFTKDAIKTQNPFPS